MVTRGEKVREVVEMGIRGQLLTMVSRLTVVTTLYCIQRCNNYAVHLKLI